MRLIINKKKLFYCVLYFFMFIFYLLPPTVIDLNSSYIISAFKIISYALIIGNAVFNPIVKSKSLNIIIAYNAILILSTFINGGDIIEATKHAIVIILVCYSISIILLDKNKKIAFIRIVRDVSLVFFIINIFLLIKYPYGIPSITYDSNFPNFLYGNVNSTIKYIIPGMCCSSILDLKYNNKKISIHTFIFLFGIFYQAFNIYFTLTALISSTFIIIWTILVLYKKEISIKSMYTLILIFILLVEAMIILNADIFGHIAAIFGKNSNLSGRTQLWLNTINNVFKKIIFGYGALEDSELVKITGNFYGAHNYFLDILLQRGIIGLILLLKLILYPIKIYKYKGTVAIDVLMGYCLSCILIFLSEPIYLKEYLIIPIIYSLNYLLELNNKNIKRTKYEG
ncbi:O-antigen ligase family protein [Anaerococcus porci]|uniref:O-antigen ligase family protein n=1 Tax=Anaerococcus porci TaxID=2652269 RepID=UPI002A753F4C|nr:O-antigen ligase family protein [Anaerococcus porci]MDY3006750.1 O-antigen ligase family protein [Anaerococcus porci]